MMGMNSGYSVGVIFLDPSDAEEMLEGLAQVRNRGHSIINQSFPSSLPPPVLTKPRWASHPSLDMMIMDDDDDDDDDV